MYQKQPPVPEATLPPPHHFPFAQFEFKHHSKQRHKLLFTLNKKKKKKIVAKTNILTQLCHMQDKSAFQFSTFYFYLLIV